MRLGILGGTFDPVHWGHVALAVEALERLGLDEVVLEVARVSPFKGAPQAPAELRVEMVGRAIEGCPGLRVGTSEILRPPPSYTIETLQEYAERGWDLWLVMGTDTVVGLSGWVRAEEIVRLARIAVGERPGFSREAVVSALPSGWLERVDWFGMRALDISSTEIRERVRAGKRICHLTPREVVRIIEENGVYI